MDKANKNVIFAEFSTEVDKTGKHQETAEMEDKDIQYLDNFEQSLIQDLLKTCTSLGMLDGTLLSSEDIDGKWKEFAPEYMAEAVPNLDSFPEAAIGWAGYIGMAVAKWWDQDWGRHHGEKYSTLHGPRGFDDMDDHIVQDILGYAPGSAQAGVIQKIMLACTQQAISKIRHEGIERQTALAFHIFARAARAMFRIGAAIQLRKEGYRFQKVHLNTIQGNRPVS